MSDREERLGDDQAIRDVLFRYWRGIDRQDPELVLGTYHPGAFDDHGYYKGPVEGFVETLRPGVWAHFSNTQHFAGNLQIDWRGPDRARVESYANAHHIQPGPPRADSPHAGPVPDSDPGRDLVYGLRYVDDFERRAGEWRIARRVCAWDWHRVDRVGGIPLPASYFRGHHSKDDPVYAHPRPHGRRVDSATLAARRACEDALMRYARGVDRRDPALVRSAYHPDAFDDHGGYQGDVDGFIAWLEETVFAAFTCTMHKLGNLLVVIDGQEAHAETYAVAHHIAARDAGGRPAVDGEQASDLVMGVRYLDRLENRGDGWKIAHRRMSFEWERSLEIGSQREYPGFLRGRRDGSDPVLVAVPGVSIARAGGAADDARSAQVVADRAAIHRQLVRYCRGIDRRDLELVRSTYHPDAFDDHGSYKGDLEGFLAFVRDEVHARFRLTMHKLGQSLIEIEGEVAHMVMGIRYVDRFEKRAGDWRIARRELRWEWVRTDALEPLDPSWTAGRVDQRDPVFQGA
jgi:SnoaL-like domain